MPVILPPENRDVWLPADSSAETLKSFLVPGNPDAMKAEPVSTAVNSARYDGPDLIRPLPEGTHLE